MKEYHSISPKEREKIMEEIKKILAKKKEVVFAVAFGSFLFAPAFRDIDIGIYFEKIKKEDVFDREIDIAGEIAKTCNLPIDVIEIKILNFAPDSFMANVFSQGKFIFIRDEKLLADLIEKFSLKAIANEYISYQSLKELVPARS